MQSTDIEYCHHSQILTPFSVPGHVVHSQAVCTSFNQAGSSSTHGSITAVHLMVHSVGPMLCLHLSLLADMLLASLCLYYLILGQKCLRRRKCLASYLSYSSETTNLSKVDQSPKVIDACQIRWIQQIDTHNYQSLWSCCQHFAPLFKLR